MQSYYEHDVREVLVSYSKENPCNPNAHRYLYEYDASQEANEMSQIASLKVSLVLSIWYFQEKSFYEPIFCYGSSTHTKSIGIFRRSFS